MSLGKWEQQLFGHQVWCPSKNVSFGRRKWYPVGIPWKINIFLVYVVSGRQCTLCYLHNCDSQTTKGKSEKVSFLFMKQLLYISLDSSHLIKKLRFMMSLVIQQTDWCNETETKPKGVAAKLKTKD